MANAVTKRLGLQRALSVLLWCGSILSLACAEKYSLKRHTIPKSWELVVRHVFFVYSKKDNPAGTSIKDKKDTAVGKNIRGEATLTGQAWVDFSRLYFEGTNETSLALQNYTGLEVSLVRYQDFLNLPYDFCCTYQHVLRGDCLKENTVRFRHKPDDQIEAYKYPMKFQPRKIREKLVGGKGRVRGAPKSKPSPKGYPQKGTNNQANNVDPHKYVVIEESGIYVLVFSNCGLKDLSNMEVAGDVVVKNPYGFLSGLDYKKLPLFMWASVIYVFLAIVWSIKCCLYFDDLFGIQLAIGGVLGLGLFECGLWFFHYWIWNTMGWRAVPLFGLAVFLSVLKSIFSYMLVLVGAMGWGLTKPTLESGTLCRIFCCVFVYIGLDLVRLIVMSSKDTEHLPFLFVVAVLVPLAILNGVIFYWVFGSLGKSIQKLKAANQTEKLKQFHGLWRVLIFALLLMTAGQVAEISTLARSIEVQWKTQWIYSDAISHGIFILVLVAMMWLWRPHTETQRYAFSTQIDDQDIDRGKGPDVATDEDAAAQPATIVGRAGDV